MREGGPEGGMCLLRLDLRNVQTKSPGRGGRGQSRSLGQLKPASQEEPLSFQGLFTSCVFWGQERRRGVLNCAPACLGQ